jgi:hypothetical protein
MSTATLVRRILLSAITITVTSFVAAAQGSTSPAQEQAGSPQPRPTNEYVIRGCLTKSTLTDIEPPLPSLKLPEKLRVTSTRTIRDQIKALSGHQVELTGALFGVPGVQEGILLTDSGAVRVYLGGADPSLGQDLAVNQNNPPMIRATMIKDVASACARR